LWGRSQMYNEMVRFGEDDDDFSDVEEYPEDDS
jgi:hypothetical protein